MAKDKYDVEAEGLLGHAEKKEPIEASSAEEARQIGDAEIDDLLGDTTPGIEDVSAVTNERTGERTEFDS